MTGLLALVLAAGGAVVPSSVLAYDAPTVSRADAHRFNGVDAEEAKLSAAGKESAWWSPEPPGTSTTPDRSVVATNPVDDVLAETSNATTRNLTSSQTLSADDALQAGERWVGEGYSELGKPGSGVYRSADGTRQFRIDEGSLTGSHAPAVPHVHLETYAPGARIPSVNNHIPFVD